MSDNGLYLQDLGGKLQMKIEIKTALISSTHQEGHCGAEMRLIIIWCLGLSFVAKCG